MVFGAGFPSQTSRWNSLQFRRQWNQRSQVVTSYYCCWMPYLMHYMLLALKAEYAKRRKLTDP